MSDIFSGLPLNLQSYYEKTILKSTPLTKDLKEVAELANEYAKNARSKNTRLAYQSDWNDFLYWCKGKFLPVLPADPSTVASYLSDRATNPWVDRKGEQRSPLKVSTLERRLTTISQVHHLAHKPFDRQNPVIKETWKGIRNFHGVAQNRKEPILLEDLRDMIENIAIEKNGKLYLIGIRDRAILLIGFAGAFRRSELAALCMEDLKFTREGIVITLRRSKTDQMGEGRDIGIPYGSNPLTCPVRAAKDWLRESGIEEGPLFRPINRHGKISLRAITHHSIAKMIKNNAFLEGREENFSGHSLRSGFATTAAIAGVPEHMIMRQTGHKKSDTIKKYIRIGNIWKENAAAKIGL